MNRIAIAQIRASTEKMENLKAAQELVREAKSRAARVIAFPEFLMAFSPASQPAEELCAVAESISGPFSSSLRETAHEANMDLLVTIYEISPVGNRVYDSALWIDSRGDIAAVYRKLHLYDAFGFRESDKFVAGNELTPPFKTAAGQIGMMICYDLRFPELARILALQGAEILIAPSGWVQGEMKLEHWQTMIRARAVENGSYVIAPNQVGNIYIGHSMVVDPFGRIMTEMGEREGLEVLNLDLGLVSEVRHQLPLLENRRNDIYGNYLGSKPPPSSSAASHGWKAS
jgi:predicted amidohydrolase